MENKTSRVASRKSKKSESKRKMRRAIWIFVSLFVASIITFIVVILSQIYSSYKDALPVMSVAPQVTTDADGKEQIPLVIPSEESVKEKPLTMALLGIDSRSGGGGLNTDVIILATFNPDTKKGHVISMPRDTLVSYTYNGKDYKQKINGVYADGHEAARKKGEDKSGQIRAGMDRVKSALSQFYDVEVTYATTVNFKGFKDVVDTLGGIDVYVDMNMKYTDSHDDTNINLTKGQQILSGQQALDFVRFRKTNTNEAASSDFQRNERQAQVIKAMLKKILSFSGVTKVKDVITEVADDVNTDMPVSELEDLIPTYITINLDNITFTSLPGTWKNPYVYPDEDALQTAKQNIQAIIAE